ncbi:MAG TPA: zf-HC2 domain-containing protein [Pyrinomonadaceae bacterium]
MKCEDIQNLISVAGDDLLDDSEREMLDRHLSTCPLCRQERDDIRNLTRELRMMRRPAIPAGALNVMRSAVAASAAARMRSFWLAEDLRPWSTWIMPSSVGALSSVVVGFAFLWTLFMIPVEKPAAMLGSVADPQLAILRRSSNASRSYADKRKDVSNESPSINPEGTLVALTNSLVRGDMKDSEVVVVADVFGSGLAQIDEVVEPSHDRHAVDELDRALRSDPAYAPFVPAAVDQRPESMKVIFKIQNVRVNTRIKGGRQ